MKQQFLHEHHNRQDKAHKPDYGERFVEEGEQYPRGGIDVRLTLRDSLNSYKLARFTLRDAKQRVLRCAVQNLQGALLDVSGFKFRFHHSLSRFANDNNLSVAEAQGHFRRVRDETQQRLQMTKTSLARADFEQGPSTPSYCWCHIRFTLFLKPLNQIDWARVCRGICLIPRVPNA